jgi:hypothetical protein
VLGQVISWCVGRRRYDGGIAEDEAVLEAALEKAQDNVQ